MRQWLRLGGSAGYLDPLSNHLMPLVARLCVGTIFWRSGQTKLDGWHLADRAVYLFQTEYRLPFIDSWTAAALTAVIENVVSVFLIAGLASRFAALVLLATTLVIELFVYPDAWTVHGPWAVCLVLVMVRGPGIASVDHWVARWTGFNPFARAP